MPFIRMPMCLCVNLHVQALLSFGGLILGAVAYHSVTVRQVEVECDQRAVLQAQGPQCRAVNLWDDEPKPAHKDKLNKC